MSTAQEVAMRAGVTRGTVSKILSRNRKYSIPEDTRRRVLLIADEMGYSPNPIAHALATGRSNTIALWTVNPYQRYISRLLSVLTEIVQADGYRTTIVTDSLENRTEESRWPVDGVLDLENGSNVTSDFTGIGGSAVPFVSLGAFHAVDSHVDYVGVDLYSGAKSALQHLLQQGWRRIQYVGTELSVRVPDPRYQAYRDVLAAAQMEPELLLLERNSRRLAFELMDATLGSRPNLKSAFFCFNDDIAIAACRAVHDHRLRIPEDIAVTGCDGIEDGEYTYPRLTTISQPYEEMSMLGWRFLLSRIKDPDLAPQGAILQPQLIIRGSSMQSMH